MTRKRGVERGLPSACEAQGKRSLGAIQARQRKKHFQPECGQRQGPTEEVLIAVAKREPEAPVFQHVLNEEQTVTYDMSAERPEQVNKRSLHARVKVR